jgi:endonuclease YncB( thermonuclease family)
MAMLVIEGTYRITGARPDGNSVRFYPANPADWDRVDGTYRVRRNNTGGAQLRLDGIDTLETHFPTTGGETHQPRRFGRAAAGELLDWLGFTSVTRNDRETVTDSEPEEVPGYIFTRTADIHGRCVAFAGKGAPPAKSGRRIHVDVAMVQRTVNFHQLTRGLAYPAFYRKLYPDLRDALTEVAVAARCEQVGLWPKDFTQSGATVDRARALTDSLVILPKLFRRLVRYLVLGDGDLSLRGFRDYLDQRGDRLFVLTTGHWTGLDSVVQVTDDDTVKLTVLPEEVVFEER